MILGVLLTFEEVFPGEEMIAPETYLVGIDKNILFKVAADFATNNIAKSQKDEIAHAFQLIFGPHNEEFARRAFLRIGAVEKASGKRGFYNPICSLQLFELAFNLEGYENVQSHAEAEVSLFKAYLILNSNFIKAQQKGFDTTMHLEGSKLHFPLMTFCTQYAYHDKINFNIQDEWVNQLIKAVYLFEFLEGREDIVGLLTGFYKRYDVANWQDFIKRFLPIANAVTLKEKEGHIIVSLNPDDTDFESSCVFLDRLVINVEEELNEWDFLSLRGAPLVKLEKGKYLVVFDLFVVEKIFKGMYFLLRDINNTLKQNACPNLRRVFTLEFSEQILLYRALENLYPNNVVKITGYEFEQQKIDAAPDYYIRKGNNALLFESKDVLILAEKKMSRDYHIYERVLEEKFLEEYDSKKNRFYNKAVLQLIDNVKRLLQKNFRADTDYNYRELKIYPILVLHDIQYDVIGLESWLDSWFQEELEALLTEGLFIKNVQPLTLINIDALLHHNEAFSQNIYLHKALDLHIENRSKPLRQDYRSREEAEAAAFGRLSPFSLFIDNYLRKQGLYIQPPIIDIVKDPLFGNDKA